MYQTSVILTLQSDSQTVVDGSIKRLRQAGFQVLRSFDLQVAREAHADCTCLHHGTEQCDCQMVVLLVYSQGDSPVTLVLHGHDGQTQVSVGDTPGQEPSNGMVEAILQALLAGCKGGGRKEPIVIER